MIECHYLHTSLKLYPEESFPRRAQISNSLVSVHYVRNEPKFQVIFSGLESRNGLGLNSITMLAHMRRDDGSKHKIDDTFRSISKALH